MNNIGQLMQASEILQQGIDNPVPRLRSLVDDMRSRLKWYNDKYPEIDTSKRWQLIQELELICMTLEKYEPIELMKTIRRGLDDAARNSLNPDCAEIWVPLKSDVDIRNINKLKIAVIDLVGFDFDSPYLYDLIGSRLVCAEEGITA